MIYRLFKQEDVERAHRTIYPFSRTAWKMLQALIEECERENSRIIKISRMGLARQANISYPSVWRIIPRLEQAGFIKYVRRNQLNSTWEVTLE